jgi:hypothetical protein
MAGKGQLRGGREDAQVRPMRRILRRQNENGLGEIEFARDRLHRVALEPFAVQDDGEWIAVKAAAGETSSVIKCRRIRSSFRLLRSLLRPR